MPSEDSPLPTPAVENPERSGRGLKGLRKTYWVFGYLRPYGRYFWPAFLALFLTAALALVFPYQMAALIGQARSGSEMGNLLRDGGAAGQIDVEVIRERIDTVALIILGALFLQAFFAYWRVRWFAKAGEQALADIRRDTYSQIIRLPMTYFGEHRVGELSSRLAADLSVISDTLLTTVPQMVRQFVMLLGGLIFIFVFSAKLSLYMLGSVAVVVLFIALLGRKIRQFSRSAQDELAASSVVVDETLQGIANVKAFGNEAYESRRYGQRLDGFVNATLKAAASRGAFVSFVILALFGAITFVVWKGGKMLVAGDIGHQSFAGFILFSIFVAGALGSLPEIMSQLQKTVGASDRVREILDEETEPADSASLKRDRLKGRVEFRNVSFRYPSRRDVRVLKDVSFVTEPGERVALVGPSGAGKSTVINLLLRFYDPDTGSVCFDGTDAREYSLAALRSQIALVPQEVLLFGGSIRDNIAYGKIDATDDEIREAARKGNAHEFIEKFPEGYETLVGDRGVKLSGGQRQRIAIARAILADPVLLILDEATSSLDSESERLVQEALEELMKGRTSIIIAHRLATVKDADRIMVIREGSIAQSGRHDELLEESDGLYRMLAQLQFD